MKTRLIIGMVIGVSAGAFAQEYDDMYFRSKDREQLNASVSSKAAANDSYSSFKKKHFEEVTMLDEYVNPSDSYSARNINPEYIARSSSAQASADEGNYFVEGFSSASTTTNAFDYNQGYYFNGWNSNQMNNMNMYTPGWYGPTYYNRWNNPWAWNDPWMNPYMGMGMNPYMGNGWNMSLGYGMGSGWGNPWNSGWNMGMGYMWGNPYYNSMRWPSSIWYCPSGSTVTVNDSRRATYAKPVSRSGNHTAYNPNATVNNYSTTPANTRSGSPVNGRVSSDTKQDDYYNPRRRVSMQNTVSNNTNRSYSNDGSRSSSYMNSTNSMNNSSSWSNNSPSRSSSFSSGSSNGNSAPVRSSGATSTGRTRGGN